MFISRSLPIGCKLKPHGFQFALKWGTQWLSIGYYSETCLIRHSMGHENNVGLGGCWIIECLLPYLCMVTVSHIMVGLERMLNYRGVGLERFHCTRL